MFKPSENRLLACAALYVAVRYRAATAGERCSTHQKTAYLRALYVAVRYRAATARERCSSHPKTAYLRARLCMLQSVTERLTRTRVRGKPSTNGKRFRGARVSKRSLTVAPRSAENRFREAGEVAWEPRPRGSGVQATKIPGLARVADCKSAAGCKPALHWVCPLRTADQDSRRKYQRASQSHL